MPTSVTSVTNNTLSTSNKRGNSTSKKTKYSKCNNKVNDNGLTFHPSISGSMHAEGLPRAIYLPTLVLIPEATLKCRQTYKRNRQSNRHDCSPYPMHRLPQAWVNKEKFIWNKCDVFSTSLIHGGNDKWTHFVECFEAMSLASIVNSLPRTVTQQRHGCDLNPGLLRLNPAR